MDTNFILDWWVLCVATLTLVSIVAWHIKKSLQKNNDNEKKEFDIELDFFSHKNDCWHCTYKDTVPKFGLVKNLKNQAIPPQTIRAKELKMENGLWLLEAIDLPLAKGEVVLVSKLKEGWKCLFRNKFGLIVPGFVHHTVHTIGRHLRPGKLLGVRSIGEKDFEPDDLIDET